MDWYISVLAINFSVREILKLLQIYLKKTYKLMWQEYY